MAETPNSQCDCRRGCLSRRHVFSFDDEYFEFLEVGLLHSMRSASKLRAPVEEYVVAKYLQTMGLPER
jgi:hypothetical protein